MRARRAEARDDMSSFPLKFGNYLLLDRINVGGMAEVFKAKAFGAAGFERILAIKRILPTLLADQDFVRMFIDEARIAVQLNHANIAQIYELGQHGSHYYIAMEYLPSRDLRAILDNLVENGQIMPISQAAYIISRVCDGLDYAHRRRDPAGQPINIIHRDVSPQNILITYDGEVKIIDFGIAKAANRASQTQAGVLKGKFGYLSPEQVRGLPIDRRSDIFAVGVMLYEMLTGERLFIGESDYSTLERVRNAEVVPPTKYNKKISRDLEEVVLRALAREPEDRYAWASDLADDLQPFLLESRSLYGGKRLALYMRETYAAEIAAERASMEAYLRVGAAELAVGGADEEEATAFGQRMVADSQAETAFEHPPEPLGVRRAAPAPAGADEPSVEEKTTILEASSAPVPAPSPPGPPGAGGGPGPRGQPAAARAQSARAGTPLRAGASAADLPHDDPLVHDDDSLAYDDEAATMVSAVNPFLDPELGATDAEERPPGASQPASAPRSASLFSGEQTQAAAPQTPGSSAAPGHDALHEPTGIADFPPPPSLPATSVTGEGPPHPDDAASADGAARAREPLVERGSPGDASATEGASPAKPSPRPALMPALWVAAACCVVTYASLLYRVVGPSADDTPSLLLRSRGETPGELRILLDGVEVARGLPTRIPLPGALSHEVAVSAAGYDRVEFQVPVLPPGQTLDIPVAWVRTESGARDDEAREGRPTPAAPAGAPLPPGPQGDEIPQEAKEAEGAKEATVPPAAPGAEPTSLARTLPVTAAPTPAEERARGGPAPAEGRGREGRGRDAPPTEPTSGAPPAAATRKAEREGRPAAKSVNLAIGTRPSNARVWVDGKRVPQRTPLMGERALRLRVGEHTLQFLDEASGRRYRYRVVLSEESPENKLIIELGQSAVVREGRASVAEFK